VVELCSRGIVQGTIHRVVRHAEGERLSLPITIQPCGTKNLRPVVPLLSDELVAKFVTEHGGPVDKNLASQPDFTVLSETWTENQYRRRTMRRVSKLLGADEEVTLTKTTDN